MSLWSRLRKAVDPFGTQTENIIANPGGYLVGRIMKEGQKPAESSAPVVLPPIDQSGASLPAALQPRNVPYSYPTTNGLLTQLAYRMAGAPNYANYSPPQNALGQQPGIPINVPRYDFRVPRDPTYGTQGLPIANPLDILQMRGYS